MADIKEILSKNPLFEQMNKEAIGKKEGPQDTTSYLDDFETITGIEALFEAKAETWGVTSLEVCKGAECVLNEISARLNRPYRRGNLTTGNVWNIAMLVLGEVIRTLPSDWGGRS